MAALDAVMGKKLQDQITQVNSDITWKLNSNTLGDGSVDFTNIEYNELSIEVFDHVLNTIYQQVIPRSQLPEVGGYLYISGYYSTSASQASMRCIVSKTNIKVDEYYINGAASANNITLGVWYR